MIKGSVGVYFKNGLGVHREIFPRANFANPPMPPFEASGPVTKSLAMQPSTHLKPQWAHYGHSGHSTYAQTVDIPSVACGRRTAYVAGMVA